MALTLSDSSHNVTQADISSLLKDWTSFGCGEGAHLLSVVMVAVRAVQTLRRATAEFRTKSASGVLGVFEKGGSSSDLVTVVDVAVENAIRMDITRQFPNHRFFGEEDMSKCKNAPSLSEFLAQQQSGTIPQGDAIWVVDPIDGTTNFVHNHPFVAVSIAVVSPSLHQTSFGVVALPFMNELYFAARDRGAWMSAIPSLFDAQSEDDVLKQLASSVCRLRVSPSRVLSESLVSTGFSVATLRTENDRSTPEERAWLFQLRSAVLHNGEVLVRHARDLRRSGSAAVDLCHLSRGITSAYFEFSINEWDIAAGCLLVEEAGGVCSGAPYGQNDSSAWERGRVTDDFVALGQHRILASGTKELLETLRFQLKDIGATKAPNTVL